MRLLIGLALVASATCNPKLPADKVSPPTTAEPKEVEWVDTDDHGRWRITESWVSAETFRKLHIEYENNSDRTLGRVEFRCVATSETGAVIGDGVGVVDGGAAGTIEPGFKGELQVVIKVTDTTKELGCTTRAE